jgi:hypothetical protein
MKLQRLCWHNAGRKPKARRLYDTLYPSLEDRSRAWLRAHPTPTTDGQDRICWRAFINYVTLPDDIRAAEPDEPPKFRGTARFAASDQVRSSRVSRPRLVS